jgi:anti-sigma B factor antagonist
VLFSLAGKITIDSSPSLRDQLLVVLNEVDIEQITIDLMNVSFIDLSGIATFIEALKTARAGKTCLLLTGLQDQPCYLLEVSGLLPLFQGAGDTQPDVTLKGQE